MLSLSSNHKDKGIGPTGKGAKEKGYLFVRQLHKNRPKSNTLHGRKRAMRKTGMWGLALVMVLLSFVGSVAYAAGPANTTASITFDAGELEFLDVGISGLQNMNISFGTNSLPFGAVSYYAQDGAHTLRVSDPNEPAGGWRVTVSLGEFKNTDASKSFTGVITLSNPALRITNNADTSNCTVPGSITIDSDDNSVMSTIAGFSRGWFDVTWQQADIMLSITESNALSITDEAQYTAVMTWTLIADGI